MGGSDEGLFACGWSKFVVWCDVTYLDVVVDFPLFDDFAPFDVEVEERVGV